MSSHKGGTNAKFSKDKRTTVFDSIAKNGVLNPGPGRYRATS